MTVELSSIHDRLCGSPVYGAAALPSPIGGACTVCGDRSERVKMTRAEQGDGLTTVFAPLHIVAGVALSRQVPPTR
jgi:hypothetical protein